MIVTDDSGFDGDGVLEPLLVVRGPNPFPTSPLFVAPFVKLC